MFSETLQHGYRKYQRYLGILFVLLILVLSILMMTYIYQTARQEIIDQSRHELLTAAAVISYSVPGDELAALRPGDENTPVFLRIRDTLHRFENSSDIRYVYTMGLDNGTVRFIVDSDVGYDPSAGRIGEVYPKPTRMLLLGFTRPAADTDFYTDRWGTLRSGYAPVRNRAGDVVGIVGVDMEESRMQERLDFLDHVLVATGICVVLLCTAGALLLDRSRVQYETMLQNEVELRREKEQIAQQSLEEKTTLLREIHHRVNNNLQILTSLISLQRRTENDPRAAEALTDCQSRILALSEVHELLYASPDVSRIDARQYLDRLGRSLIIVHSPSRQNLPFSVTAPHLSLSLARAIPLGLMLNELISNSVRHGFLEEKPPAITIDLSLAEGSIVFTYRDSGPGLPPGTDPKQSTTLGFRLVHVLADQLRAEIVFLPGPGFALQARFPGDPPDPA